VQLADTRKETTLETEGLNHVAESPDLAIIDKIRRVFSKSCKRILLINPPHFPDDLLDIKIVKNSRYYNYPPYGLGLLGRNLKTKGYIYGHLDLNLELLQYIHNEENKEVIPSRIKEIWKEKINAKIKEIKPDLVGLSCMFTMSHGRIIDIADYLKQMHPGLPIIAGGVHVSNAPDLVLKEAKGIDFLSLFESDLSFCDLLDYINGKGSEDQLAQLGTLIDEEYVFLKKRHSPSVQDMDVFPEYADLPVDKYIDYGEMGNFRYWIQEGARVSSILSNRGCRAHCTFCSVANFNGKGVRARSIDSVLDEIEYLGDRYGINHITWLDDDLFFDTQRTVALFNGIVKRNLGITWDAMNGIIVSAAATHPETIDAASKSGCVAINWGVESGNTKILGQIQKPSGIKHCLKVGELMRKYPQIYSRNFLIIGFPNETLGQMLDTIKLAQEMGSDWNGIQKLTPLPNTKIYDQMIDEGLIQHGPEESDEYSFNGRYFIRETEKHRIKEKKQKLNAEEFINFFEQNLEMVPTVEQLDDIWLIMDYKLNYEKILEEENPLRLKKMHKFLWYVSNRMTKNHPLAALFLGIVHRKLGDPESAKACISTAQEYLNQSAYWQTRFKVLSLDHLLREH
tara:strand:+ start:4093 stop:5964 length:1872 start_codon:yes stop_codon:yes gene_type:complete